MIFIIVILLNLNIYGQEEIKKIPKLYFSGYLGRCFSNSKNLNIKNSINLGVIIDYKIKKNHYLCLELNRNYFDYDFSDFKSEDELIKSIKNNLHNVIDLFNLNTNKFEYNFCNTNIGYIYKLNKNKFYNAFRLTTGISHFHYNKPEQFNIINNNTVFKDFYKNKKGYSLILGYTAGIKINKYNDCLLLDLLYNYQYVKPLYNTTTIKYDNNNMTIDINNTYKSINLNNYILRIGYVINF